MTRPPVRSTREAGSDDGDDAEVVGGVHPVQCGGVGVRVVHRAALLHRDRRVVDEDVQAAEVCDHVVDQRLRPARVRLVGLEGDGLGSLAVHLVDYGPRRLLELT